MCQIAGKKTETLTRFDRRAHEDDAFHRVTLERIDSAGDCEIGLAGTRRADAEGDIVTEDLFDIQALVRRTPGEIAFARHQHRPAAGRFHRAGAAVDHAELHVVHFKWFARAGVKTFQQVEAARDLFAPAFHAQARAAPRDDDIERGFDLAQIGVERAAQIGQALIVERLEIDLRRVRFLALRAGQSGGHQMIRRKRRGPMLVRPPSPLRHVANAAAPQ